MIPKLKPHQFLFEELGDGKYMFSRLKKEEVKQLLSYFCVGGISAVVEWLTFLIFANVLKVQYLGSTGTAFVLATLLNWLLGRMFTFKNSQYKEKKAKELALVFFVSSIGLLLNLLLMYLLIDVLLLNSSIQTMLCKVFTTGVVFIWNFLSRKLLVYKDS